jgi:hypothetical protein
MFSAEDHVDLVEDVGTVRAPTAWEPGAKPRRRFRKIVGQFRGHRGRSEAEAD